jgi:hypothetical protein
MARPKLVGTYNQNLSFEDENPFQVKFDEARKRAKDLATEAYDKKKEDFLSEYFVNLRMTMMPPAGVSMVVTDPATGKKRLNKGFYKVMDMTPEKALQDARAAAQKAGLPASAIKMNDILNKTFNDLHTEAIKRQYEHIAQYRDQYGSGKTQELLKNEGTKFLSFYRKFTDPYVDPDGHGGLFKSQYSSDIVKAINNAKGSYSSQDDVNNAWLDRLKNDGFGIKNKDGVAYVTDIPWSWDGDNEYEVKWDDNGPYVERGLWGAGVTNWNPATQGMGGGKHYLNDNLRTISGQMANPDQDKANQILNPNSPIGQVIKQGDE